LGLAIFCDALSVPAYWVCYHLYFTAEEKLETTGKEVGLVTVLNNFAQVLGPVVGGILITYVGGFELLLATNAALLLLSNLPLIKGLPNKEYAVPVSYNFTGSIPSYAQLGFVSTIILLISTLVILTAGRLIDLKGSKQVLEGSALLVAIGWVGQLFSRTIWPLTLFSGFYAVAKSALSTAADSLTYQKAHKEDPVLFLIGRNIAIDLGKAVALFMVAGLLWAGVTLQNTFSLGIVAVALAGLLSYRHAAKIPV